MKESSLTWSHLKVGGESVAMTSVDISSCQVAEPYRESKDRLRPQVPHRFVLKVLSSLIM